MSRLRQSNRTKSILCRYEHCPKVAVEAYNKRLFYYSTAIEPRVYEYTNSSLEPLHLKFCPTWSAHLYTTSIECRQTTRWFWSIEVCLYLYARPRLPGACLFGCAVPFVCRLTRWDATMAAARGSSRKSLQKHIAKAVVNGPWYTDTSLVVVLYVVIENTFRQPCTFFFVLVFWFWWIWWIWCLLAEIRGSNPSEE